MTRIKIKQKVVVKGDFSFILVYLQLYDFDDLTYNSLQIRFWTNLIEGCFHIYLYQ